MKCLRVLITGWTASFRYPAFVSGFQPTLFSPPLSTIYGLLSAIKGDYVTPNDFGVGFVFDFKSLTVDLESIYQLGKNKDNKENILKREILISPKLYLYIPDLEFEEYLKKPRYPILLGRSSDFAKINNIEIVDLNEKENVRLGKTILPYGTEGAFGIIQALPTHFSNTIPRKAMGTQPFIIMDDFFEYKSSCCYDSELDWGVWIHE